MGASYYDALLRFMDGTVAHGFVAAPQRAVLEVSADPAALLDRIAALASTATAPDDYRRI